MYLLQESSNPQDIIDCTPKRKVFSGEANIAQTTTLPEANAPSVLLVYFLSRQKPIRSFLLYQSYNIMLNVDPIYSYYISTCIFLFSTIIPTVLDLCLYIFVLDNNPPDKI
jgi:hypothetical protein